MSNNITVNKELNNTISVIQSTENKVTISSAVTQVGGAGSGDKTFVSNFTNLTWIASNDEFYIEINHSLDKYPSVSVVDSVNNVVYLAVEYLNKNSVRLYTRSKFSGKAYMN